MMKKRYLFLALITLICILSVSAVSASDESISDINTNDNQALILEENVQMSSDDNGKIIIGEKEPNNSENNEEIILGEKEPNNAEDNEEIILGEKEPNNAENNGEIIAQENKKDVSSDADDNKKITVKKKNSDSAKQKTNTKKTAKSSSKKKTTFKTISKGSKDKAMVKKIQKALKKNGYYLRYKNHYLMVDGWYGPCTFRAVKQFQKAKKLKVTGNVDEKTAEKLKIIDNSNAIIKLAKGKTFKREYKSGDSFRAKIVNKRTGKGIETILRVYYYKHGKQVGYKHIYYCTGEDGANDITPDDLPVGTYKLKVTCEEGKIKAIPKTKTIIITKTSISLKANDVILSDKQNVQLKASLRFKNNEKVNEGNVRFTIGGKSYLAKVKNGNAVINLKRNQIRSKAYKVEFLGTGNIKSKSTTGKIRK